MRVSALLLTGACAIDDVPDSFDCGMRQLAYKHGKQLLPRLGKFEPLYYALNLNDPACPTELEGEPQPASLSEIPADAIFVDAKSGKDASAGSEQAPLKTIEAALAKAPQGTIVLREGTYHQTASLQLGPGNSGLTIMAYPNEKPVISGGKELHVSWQPHNVSEATFQVTDDLSAVFAGKADDVHIHDLGKQLSAEDCQSACARYPPCTGFTWHDATQGDFANVCWGRIDGVWSTREQAGHVSGRKVSPMNIYSSKLQGQVAEVPGLQLDGVRATRARYPNLPAGIEASPGYDAMISGSHASWTPPDFDRFGPVEYYTDTSHTRNDTSGPFLNYMIGTNGLCSVYDPPVGYWCSEHPAGGGAFAFRTPSGVTPATGVLPNGPYKDVSEMIINVWRPNRWANWMFQVADYDSEAGNFTFGAGGNQGARGADTGGDFFVENVLEELDQPGEFFYDKQSDELFLFFNGTGAPPADLEVIVPAERVLVNISGSQWDPVRNVTLSGLTFKSTRYTYMDPHGVPSAGDWALDRTAAVFIEGAESTTLVGSAFERLDGNGVMISGYNRHTTVQDCDFAYIGGNAVVSWGYTNETATSGFPYYRLQDNFPQAGVDGTDGNHPRYNQILGNSAREVGLYEKQSSFYMQAKTAESTISGNVFFNGPRAGINFNDGFGGGDSLNTNLVFSTCRESGDHGPFNSWDRQPFLTTVHDGTPSLRMAWREIYHNFFIDNYSPQENVDNDDGSAYYKTHDNFLVYGGSGMKANFGGHDNHHYNNIYAYVGKATHVGGTLTGHENQFYGNKLVLTGIDLGELRCSEPVTQLHDNLYFTGNGTLTECGGSLADAQAQGYDMGSTVALIPEDDVILGWAAKLFGIGEQQTMTV